MSLYHRKEQYCYMPLYNEREIEHIVALSFDHHRIILTTGKSNFALSQAKDIFPSR